MSDSEHWLTLNGARLRYVAAGAGPPLVLLHGLVAYSFSWRFVISPLAEHFRVYALDMLGCGFSDCPAELTCGIRADAERLLQILDALQISSCDLVATSYGGAVAMVAASLAPQRIARLALVAPVNPWSEHGKVLAPFLSNPVIAWLFLRLYPHLQASQGYFLRRLFGGSQRVPSDSAAGYAAALRRPGVLRHALKTIRSWNGDLRLVEGLLPSIKHIPVLFVWGEEDKAVSIESAGRLREQLHNSQMTTFAGVGHLPYEEAPEEFTRAILEFFH
ncbi:MAG TPA: alpha/beta hydrolase [Terriglobales bacterium]